MPLPWSNGGGCHSRKTGTHLGADSDCVCAARRYSARDSSVVRVGINRSCEVVRNVSSGGEVDEAALRVCGDELHGDLVAHIEAFAAMDEHSIYMRVEGADECAVVVDAGDDGRKALADARVKDYGGDALLHLALDLAGAVFHEGAALGDGVEIVLGVGLG